MDDSLNVNDHIIRWELGEEAFRMWKQESGNEKLLRNNAYRDSEIAIKLFPRFVKIIKWSEPWIMKELGKNSVIRKLTIKNETKTKNWVRKRISETKYLFD